MAKPDVESSPGRLHGRRAQAFASLNAVLKPHLRRSADGRKVVSHATIADRSEFYSRLIHQLHELGYPLTNVHHLKPKHIDALMKRWEGEGLSASTLQKRFSYLTLLCRWIGKASMLRPGASYLADPGRYRRTYAADHDHSWTAVGIDPLEKIAAIEPDDPAVARVLRLQHAFGLRIQEASLLNPARDTVGEAQLRIVAGTKGGRPRVVPIETAAQRAVLAEAHGYAGITRRSMIPPEYDLKQWLTHCYHVLGRHGVTRQAGLVSHGLRHHYANDVYEQLTGEVSPVRGGAAVDSALNLPACREVASRLGHARPAITTAYCGPERPVAPPPSRELRVQQQLLAVRIRDHIGIRQRGGSPVSANTLAQRWTVLNHLLQVLARDGAPLHTPDALGEAQVALLLRHWRHIAARNVATARHQMQVFAQLCGWLDRPDLALQVRALGKSLTRGAQTVLPGPLSPDEIAVRIDRIRAQDARVALHLELVRVVGLTHRQAARLQPAASYRDGQLNVIWETPKNQVLQYALTGERQRAVLQDALTLLPDPQDAVCPASLTMSTWLRQVYHLQRTLGRIGVPGEPTWAELKDPAAPMPTLLYREDWLLQRAGLARGPAPKKPSTDGQKDGNTGRE